MVPPKPAYDVDWIFTQTSNVHVANDPGWFISYTPFPTIYNCCFGAPEGILGVAGVGDVELPTKTHRTRSGAAFHGTIILRDVLYAPRASCNVMGGPVLEDYEYDSRAQTIRTKTTRSCVGLIDSIDLYRIRLRGQSANHTSRDPQFSARVVSALWEPSERARWKLFQSGQDRHSAGDKSNGGSHSTSLTQEEKTWLKENYGGEFRFLRCHGLSIYNEDDRIEGRRILQAFMHNSDDGDDDYPEVTAFRESSSETDSIGSFQRELEEDPASHAADYHFSEEELDFIKQGFGHSGNFLRSYGLKFYDDEDCQEGKAIIRAMLT